MGFSQALTPEIIATSGDYYTSLNNSLSWTMGECIIETFTGSNNMLTQGFQQSSYLATPIQESMNEEYSFSIYPNPASSFVSICTDSKGMKKLRADMFDLSGRMLYSEAFENNLQMNLSGYANSSYFIRIYDEKNNVVQTYHLQKNN